MTSDRTYRNVFCVWEDEHGEGNWTTGCDNIFILLEGNPFDNEMKFCPYCGGLISV